MKAELFKHGGDRRDRKNPDFGRGTGSRAIGTAIGRRIELELRFVPARTAEFEPPCTPYVGRVGPTHADRDCTAPVWNASPEPFNIRARHYMLRLCLGLCRARTVENYSISATGRLPPSVRKIVSSCSVYSSGLPAA